MNSVPFRHKNVIVPYCFLCFSSFFHLFFSSPLRRKTGMATWRVTMWVTDRTVRSFRSRTTQWKLPTTPSIMSWGGWGEAPATWSPCAVSTMWGAVLRRKTFLSKHWIKVTASFLPKSFQCIKKIILFKGVASKFRYWSEIFFRESFQLWLGFLKQNKLSLEDDRNKSGLNSIIAF